MVWRQRKPKIKNEQELAEGGKRSQGSGGRAEGKIFIDGSAQLTVLALRCLFFPFQQPSSRPILTQLSCAHALLQLDNWERSLKNKETKRKKRSRLCGSRWCTTKVWKWQKEILLLSPLQYNSISLKMRNSVFCTSQWKYLKLNTDLLSG